MIRSFPSLLLPRRHPLQLGLGATVVAAAIHPTLPALTSPPGDVRLTGVEVLAASWRS